MANAEQRGEQPQQEETRINRRQFVRGTILAGVGFASMAGGLTDAAIGAFQAIKIREKFPHEVAEQKLAQEGHSKGRMLTDAGFAIGGVVPIHEGALDLMDARMSDAAQAPAHNEVLQTPPYK